MVFNLHDYCAAKYNWHQLWADDRKAFVLEATPNGRYNVIVVEQKMGYITDLTERVAELSDAMNKWNTLINKHLAQKTVQGVKATDLMRGMGINVIEEKL